MANASVRDWAASEKDKTDEIIVTLPTYSEGDLLLIYLSVDIGASEVASGLSGWSLVQDIRTGIGSSDSRMFLYSKTATSSESNPTVTMTIPARDMNRAVCASVKDHNGIDVSNSVAVDNRAVASIETPALTTTEDNCLVINAVAHRGDSYQLWVDLPETVIWSIDDNTGIRAMAASRVLQALAGVASVMEFAASDNLEYPVAISLAIKSTGLVIGDTYPLPPFKNIV